MKKLELQKIIREEIKKSLNENYRDTKENVAMSGMREATVKKDDLDKIGDFIMSMPQFERFSTSALKSAIKDMHSEWKKVAPHYKSIEDYFDEIEETGGEEAFMESKKPSKSKKSLKEGFAWERSERKFGESLPTLASIQKAYQNKKQTTLTEAKFQKGDKVKPLVGPHKGVEHEVIAVLHNIDKPGEDIYNIRPIGLKAAEIKYKLGAAGAKASDLEAV